jgi:hypothetical protein
MILWMFDTSMRELVYCDPQAGAIRFSFDVVKAFDENASEIALRKLPRANNSNLVIAGGLRLR